MNAERVLKLYLEPELDNYGYVKSFSVYLNHHFVYRDSMSIDESTVMAKAEKRLCIVLARLMNEERVYGPTDVE